MALWEGLTGARPFDATTIDDLRAQIVAATPARAARIPRRVRSVLTRALAVDPGARWPDLETLLVALDRAARGPRRLAVAAATALALTGGAAAIALAGGSTSRSTEDGCDVHDRDFDEIWSPAVAARLDDHFDRDPAWLGMRQAIDRLAGD